MKPQLIAEYRGSEQQEVKFISKRTGKEEEFKFLSIRMESDNDVYVLSAPIDLELPELKKGNYYLIDFESFAQDKGIYRGRVSALKLHK